MATLHWEICACCNHLLREGWQWRNAVEAFAEAWYQIGKPNTYRCSSCWWLHQSQLWQMYLAASLTALLFPYSMSQPGKQAEWKIVAYIEVHLQILPPSRYVYQKAYVEFFCSPEKFSELESRVQGRKTLTYMAVNATGEVKSSLRHNEANAVTWGVFPAKEVIQPTIVDPHSFSVWKVFLLATHTQVYKFSNQELLYLCSLLTVIYFVQLLVCAGLGASEVLFRITSLIRAIHQVCIDRVNGKDEAQPEHCFCRKCFKSPTDLEHLLSDDGPM